MNIKRSLSAREGLVNIALILLAHLFLLAWISLAFQFQNIWIFILSPLVFFLHQRYLSEWMHEAAHGHLCPNRKLNELFTSVFIAPVFISPISVYRAVHFHHHTKKDYFEPDDFETGIVHPINRISLILGVINDVLGISAIYRYSTNIFGLFSTKKATSSKKSNKSTLVNYLLILFIHLSIVSFLVYFNFLIIYLLYYFTIATFYSVQNRMRIYVQHLQINDDGNCIFRGSTASRSIKGGIFSKLFYSSDVMAFHHEHHKWPSLTFRQARSLCKENKNINVYCEKPSIVLKALISSI